MILRFDIPGEPVPKGSRIVGRRRDGSTYTREASKRAGPAMDVASRALWVQANQQRARFGSRAVTLTALFLCAKPGAPRYGWPVRGDLDKLTRFLADALVKAGAVADDRHIIGAQVFKAFTTGPPRTVGTVQLADPLDPGALASLLDSPVAA